MYDTIESIHMTHDLSCISYILVPCFAPPGQAPQVLAAKRKFLPDEVPLSEWIDRRIGGEAGENAGEADLDGKMIQKGFGKIWIFFGNMFLKLSFFV